MARDIQRLTDFLLGLGTDQVPHAGDGNFLAHLVAVHRDLEAWGCEEAVCLAGLFHSIYGTEKFQRFSLPLERRDDVRELVGERAERLAYLNSAMDRPSFDAILEAEADGPRRMVDRFRGEEAELTPEDFDDLCRVHLCDWLEQVPRTTDRGYRRAAYRRLADHLGGVAREAYDRVFGLESAEADAGRKRSG